MIFVIIRCEEEVGTVLVGTLPYEGETALDEMSFEFSFGVNLWFYDTVGSHALKPKALYQYFCDPIQLAEDTGCIFILVAKTALLAARTSLYFNGLTIRPPSLAARLVLKPTLRTN